MRPLISEKEKAIQLRKQGLSYREIRKQIPVAKSSLSLWLKDTPLSKEEKKSLRNRVSRNVAKGRILAAAAHRNARLERERKLFHECKEMYSLYENDPFFAAGIALYWAEGAKRSSGFQFVNSDDEMMQMMVLWIETFLAMPRSQMKVRLFIHRPYAHERCEEQWSIALDIPLANFQKTIYKPTGRLVKKRPQYKGCLRLEIGQVRYLRMMQFLQSILFANFVKKSTLSELRS